MKPKALDCCRNYSSAADRPTTGSGSNHRRKAAMLAAVQGLRLHVYRLHGSESRLQPVLSNTSSLSDLGVSHVIAGCLFLTRKSATVENARLAKFSAPKSDRLLDRRDPPLLLLSRTPTSQPFPKGCP